MKTCLIIGVDSFTGRYIAQAFADEGGFNLYGTYRSDAGESKDLLVDSFQVDLLNYSEVKNAILKVKPDLIIHLAGISFAANENILQYFDVHVIGTRNILKAAVESEQQFSKIILASTGQVYGHATEITESTDLSPLNDYANSKLAMEYMAKTWLDQLPIVFVRPFNYIGVGQAKHFVVPKIIDAFARQSKDVSLGRTDVKRDFSDVRYIAKCYLALAFNGNVGETYNLASGRSLSIDYLIETLSEISGIKVSIIKDERFIRKSDPDIVSVNNSKIIEMLGESEVIPIEETLQWVYRHESRS